jgi:hypothetical protein
VFAVYVLIRRETEAYMKYWVKFTSETWYKRMCNCLPQL